MPSPRYKTTSNLIPHLTQSTKSRWKPTTNMSPLFASLVILLLIAAGAAGASPAPVLDIDGNVLDVGTRYHIMPVRKDTFGGLYSGPRNFTVCPMYIRQAPSALLDGITANFVPVDGSKTIRLSTDMNVEFFESNLCPEQPIWTLAPPAAATGRRYVKYGGVLGNPGPSTVNNWFRIEKSGDSYKMVFCPGVCKTCKVPCRDLGVHAEGDDRWFVLGGRTFAVKFKKQ
ncbi:kunitz trypsin inhibitor 5-like [Nymphaea colorata]|nr:kunitz trypsin inhibitor 5-like [Nymphaea colorata]